MCDIGVQTYTEVWQCDVCPNQYESFLEWSKHALEEHIPRPHGPDNEYKCTDIFCGQKLKSHHEMVKHLEEVHVHMFVFCDDCLDEFYSMNEAINHKCRPRQPCLKCGRKGCLVCPCATSDSDFSDD